MRDQTNAYSCGCFISHQHLYLIHIIIKLRLMETWGKYSCHAVSSLTTTQVHTVFMYSWDLFVDEFKLGMGITNLMNTGLLHPDRTNTSVCKQIQTNFCIFLFFLSERFRKINCMEEFTHAAGHLHWEEITIPHQGLGYKWLQLYLSSRQQKSKTVEQCAKVMMTK